MDINIYVNQKKINPLCRKAIAEYIKRLTPYCSMSIVCSPGRMKCVSAHSHSCFAITEDCSSTISSEGYAASINVLTAGGTSKISYYIGYPSDMLNDCIPDIKEFSLCTVSPSYEMSALLLSEQIYRAYTILNNITYHK